MNNLCLVLPPFAPDYSGVASSLFELGGMIVIHDASGCTGNYLGYDEPRWMNSTAQVFCSGLRHMDAVLGNDAKLVQRMVEAARSLQPRFIALLGSPVPMVIGTDYNGIAAEVEAATGIPSFGFDTKGLALYDKGIALGTITMLKHIAPHTQPNHTIPHSVNMLGLTPLDFGNNGNAQEIRACIEQAGIRVLSTLSMGATLEDMQCSPQAQLNVAVSYAGIEIARYMERTYHIPYIATVPLGTGSSFIEQLCTALDKTALQHAQPAQNSARRVLIVGEQVLSCAVRNELRRTYGIQNCELAVLFNAAPELLEKTDRFRVCEHDLMALLNSGTYTDVVADPLVEQLIRVQGVRFHALPHTAVSSKVHWDETRHLVSQDMQQFLLHIAKS